MSSESLKNTGQSRDLGDVGRTAASVEKETGEGQFVQEQEEKQALMGDSGAPLAGKGKMISGVHQQTLVAGACFCLASGGMVRVLVSAGLNDVFL